MGFGVIAAERGYLKDGRFITDRAKRYRAQNAVEGPKRCFSCGAPLVRNRRPMVAHIDGCEENGATQNLAYACRSCNVRMANTMLAAGIGKRTRQYNPRKKSKSSGHAGGAHSLGEYLSAVQIARGDQPGNVKAAVKTIHDTSPARRSEFAERIWDIRRQRYGASGRQQEIPF